jgi:prepilin-type N-terminal cleavage/methylation domain-containing protein
MKTRNKRSNRGFTIIEAIVVLVVVAIFLRFFWIFFMDKVFLQSHVPRQNLVRANDLNQVMENIRADYKPYPVWTPNHVYSANDKVMPTPFSLSGQRYWYICTNGGTSDPTEPAWTQGGVVTEVIGGVQWTYQGDLMKLSELYGYIGVKDTVNKKCASPSIPPEKCYDKSTNQYGYYVTEKKWIDFDTTNTEFESGNNNILKVTISGKDDSGSTVAAVTALFF